MPVHTLSMNALDFLNSCNHCAALVVFVVYCRRSFRHLACIIRLGENGLCAPPPNHSPSTRHRRYLPPTGVPFPPNDISHITNVWSNLRSPSVAKWSVSALPECFFAHSFFKRCKVTPSITLHVSAGRLHTFYRSFVPHFTASAL